MQRYTPTLPTYTDARADQTSILSDHAPVLNNFGNGGTLISWNVAQRGVSGFGIKVETPSQRNERFQRIAAALKLMVEKINPVFIALQEAHILAPRIEDEGKGIGKDEEDQEPDLIAIILKQIGAKWKIAQTYAKGDCVTLYNSDDVVEVLRPDGRLEQTGIDGKSNSGFGTEYNVFKGSDADSKHRVNFLNVHGMIRDVPFYHVHDLEIFLERTHDQTGACLSFVVGDFNTHLFQPLQIEQSIATSITNRQNSANEQYQGAAAVDGCFYSQTVINADMTRTLFGIQQSTTTFLMPDGLVQESVPYVRTANEDQQRELAKYNFVLAAPRTRTHKLNNNFTVGQYDDYVCGLIQEKYHLSARPLPKNPCFGYVGWMANLNNEKRIGVILPKQIIEKIKANHSNGYLGFGQVDDRLVRSYVSVDPRIIQTLINAIDVAFDKELTADQKAQAALELKQMAPEQTTSPWKMALPILIGAVIGFGVALLTAGVITAIVFSGGSLALPLIPAITFIATMVGVSALPAAIGAIPAAVAAISVVGAAGAMIGALFGAIVGGIKKCVAPRQRNSNEPGGEPLLVRNHLDAVGSTVNSTALTATQLGVSPATFQHTETVGSSADALHSGADRALSDMTSPQQPSAAVQLALKKFK